MFERPASVILSSLTRVKLAVSIHVPVTQPAAHHDDQSLKEQGGQRQPLIPLITPEGPN